MHTGLQSLCGMELASSSSVAAYRGSYRWKAGTLLFVLLADLVIGSFADHYHNEGHGLWYPLVLLR